MEIIFCDLTHTVIHITNKETEKKILNFINGLEKTPINDYSIEFFDNKNLNTDIINCYGTKFITFNRNIIKPLDLTNFVSLKKIKYPSNIELIQFPDGLEEIEFGIEFNSSIDNLPPNIKKIIFYPDSKFNQPINNLPTSLEELQLGKHFSQSLDFLPESLKVLKIYSDKKLNLDNLPIGLEILKVVKK